MAHDAGWEPADPRGGDSGPPDPVAEVHVAAGALPILYDDRLVGKLDATADRIAGALRVDAIHQDVTFNKTMTAAIDHEIKDLAHWLELDLILPGRS